MSRMLSKMDSTDGKMSEVFELELDHPIGGESHQSRQQAPLRYESDDDAIDMDQVSSIFELISKYIVIIVVLSYLGCYL